MNILTSQKFSKYVYSCRYHFYFPCEEFCLFVFNLTWEPLSAATEVPEAQQERKVDTNVQSPLASMCSPWH